MAQAQGQYKLIEEPTASMNMRLEIGILSLRIVVSLMLLHHGLQKFHNPDGFAENMVAKWFPFLPVPIFWTYLAALMEIFAPLFLAFGIFARLAAFGLFMTMCFATSFHFMATGFEGFPLGVPKAGAYTYEPSLLCGAIFVYFMLAGPGKLSLQQFLPKSLSLL